MTRIDVDPEALAAAGRAVTGIGDEFAAAVGTLSSAVSAGAPSGFDPAGVAFGMVYQTSAQALLDAGAAMVNASHNVGFGIGMSATNYSQANAASTVGGGAAPLPAPEKPVEFDTPSCPSSLGGGVMPPFLWSLLQTFIPDTWPDGNAARLRASAGAWQTFATAISGIAGQLSGPSGVVGAQRIPEGGAIGSAMSELTQSLSDVATEAVKLATQTREFADDVQATQDAIRDLCDRISPAGVFDGIKAVFSGDALDEIKEIADDVKQVLENFGRQVDGRISLMQSLITALDGAVVSLQQRARREFTHYLGEDVGGALATALEVPSNVGEGVVKAGLNGIIGIQQLDPTRFASDPEGAGAAWSGILNTLKYATPTGAAMDPIGAFEHGKDVLGGIAHVEDWRADRPGLGLGGVLFEAGSAATGIGAARTGLRGASAAAEAGDAGPAVRAAGSAAEATAPIAGRASEIAAKLDDLTTLADDIPSGAAPGSHGPTLPTSLAEPDVPRVPEAPRAPEMSAPQGVPDGAGPRSVSDAPAPHAADVPEASPRPADVSSHAAPEGPPVREPEPAATPSTGAALEGAEAEGTRPPVAPAQSAETVPSPPAPGMAPSELGPAAANPDGSALNDFPDPSGDTSSASGGHLGVNATDPVPASSGGEHGLADGHESSSGDAQHPHPVHEPPAPLPNDSPIFEGYDGVDPGPEYRNADGSLIYPDDSLPDKPYAVPGTVVSDARLEAGTVIDRFGYPGGAWLSPEGTPFLERALPPDSATKPYFTYVVDDPTQLPPGWQIEQSVVAPWFDQPGGGVQYRIIAPEGERPSVQTLLDWGYLREAE